MLLVLLVLLELHTLKVNALTETLFADNSRFDVKVGETIAVTLKVQDIENIYGIDLALSYNEDVVVPVKEKFQEGSLLLGKHIFTAVNRIGNGEAKFMATLLGQESLPSQGELLRASFEVRKRGNGDISVKDIKLLDRTGKKIEYEPPSILLTVDSGRGVDNGKADANNVDRVSLEQDGISIGLAGEIVDKKHVKVVDIHNITQTGITLRSKIYEIGGIEAISNEPITVMMKYASVDVETKKLGLYYYHEGRRKWLYMGGIVDESRQVITMITKDIPFKQIAVFENNEYVQFVDLPEEAIDDSMKKVLMLGLMKGYEDFTFRPDKEITREELLCVMLRVLEIPVLTKMGQETYLDTSDWAEPYIYTAKMLNIINGYEDGSIRGRQSISMMEAAVIIDRALKLKEPIVHVKLNNQHEIPPWAIKSFEKLVAYDILPGTENPPMQLSETISRKEVVMFLAKTITFLKI